MDGVKTSEVRLTRRQIREALGWGDTALKVHLRRLVELEYLVGHRQRGPSPTSWSSMVGVPMAEPSWPGSSIPPPRTTAAGQGLEPPGQPPVRPRSALGRGGQGAGFDGIASALQQMAESAHENGPARARGGYLTERRRTREKP